MGLAVAARFALWHDETAVGLDDHDPETMSETQVRRWVCTYRQLIRQAEQAEVRVHVEKRNDLIVARRQKHQVLPLAIPTSL
jgi:hypothetical protein